MPDILFLKINLLQSPFVLLKDSAINVQLGTRMVQLSTENALFDHVADYRAFFSDEINQTGFSLALIENLCGLKPSPIDLELGLVLREFGSAESLLTCFFDEIMSLLEPVGIDDILANAIDDLVVFNVVLQFLWQRACNRHIIQ